MNLLKFVLILIGMKCITTTGTVYSRLAHAHTPAIRTAVNSLSIVDFCLLTRTLTRGPDGWNCTFNVEEVLD